MDNRTRTELVVKAIQNITGNATKWSLVNGEISSLVWKEVDIEKPSDADIKTEYDKLVEEYDAQEYARNRASEYPSNGDQWDMIYKDMKNSTTTHADAVEAVKTKWPKDNSGPIE